MSSFQYIHSHSSVIEDLSSVMEMFVPDRNMSLKFWRNAIISIANTGQVKQGVSLFQIHVLVKYSNFVNVPPELSEKYDSIYTAYLVDKYESKIEGVLGDNDLYVFTPFDYFDTNWDIRIKLDVNRNVKYMEFVDYFKRDKPEHYIFLDVEEHKEPITVKDRRH